MPFNTYIPLFNGVYKGCSTPSKKIKKNKNKLIKLVVSFGYHVIYYKFHDLVY